MTVHDTINNWHKSTFSDKDFENCVEVGTGDGVVGIRDTKQQHLPNDIRPALVVTPTAFTGLLQYLGG